MMAEIYGLPVVVSTVISPDTLRIVPVHPRLTDYATERQYLVAVAKWRRNVYTVRGLRRV